MDLDPATIKATLDAAKLGFSTLDAAITSIKKLRELVKPKAAEPEDPKALEIRALIVDLQEQLLAAREEALTFRQVALRASEALQRESDFDERRGLYRLVELGPGNFAYQTGDESERRLACVTCFDQNRKIVTLQMSLRGATKDVFSCPVCKNTVSRPNNFRQERAAVRRQDW